MILLAEDEPLVRNLIRSVLTARGYGVIDARDGREALELSRQYPDEIHLLLTDVRMPRMTGPELAIEIRKERPDIRVLVMSAESSNQLAVLSRGKNFIRKPFAAKALRDKVDEVMRELL
jgi:two-component system cell cycle sensor histidine kinase/response regulator CckA